MATGILDMDQAGAGKTRLSKRARSVENKLNTLKRHALALGEDLGRSLAKEEMLSVYYPEYSIIRHPRLRFVMYGSRSPVLWSPRRRASLYHFVNRPIFIPSPGKSGFVLEPNDHILTFCNTFEPHLPKAAIRDATSILDRLVEKGMRGLLVNTRTGLINQLDCYLPDYAKELVIHYEDARCVNRITSGQLAIRQKKLSDPGYLPRICVLAAGWVTKHVSALVYAYTSRARRAHLILCVPDMPQELELVLSESGNKYTILKESPLSEKQKSTILRESDISVSLTAIDGGSNALEGVEYGHAIITNQYHRQPQFSNRRNAFICDFGTNYYDLESWGVAWQNVEEFVDQTPHLRDPLNRHFSDSLVDQIDQYISTLLDDRELLARFQRESMSIAQKYSCEASNQSLRNIYSDLS